MVRSTNLLVFIVGGLMLITGGIYFYESYSESQEFNTELAAQAETMFFATAGILYIPFGIWMLKSKLASRAPYIISIIGSVALIILYIASRNVNLPLVGQQEDVGITDLASKVLQMGIIIICSILLVRSKSRVT
jgi:hypothetical protein